jgi:hypothetical protein
MFLPKTPAFLMSVITLVVSTSAFAQSQPAADGFTLQERAGIVLVKPQAWSKDSEAVVVEFQAFTDRTASGSAGAGYIEFKTKATDNRQIPKAKIVKMVVYPDPKLVTEVITQKDRDSLEAVATDLKATVAKFPSTRTYVEPAFKKVSEELAIYDSGKVKTGGNWVNKDVYVAERARTYGSQIKTDIVNAEPPSSFDLANDPRYIALEEMAKTNPSVKPLVTDLSNLYGKRVRGEQRTALLAKLAEPEIDLAEAKGAVARLKTLQPDEDPRSVNFLKNWDAAIAKVDAIKADGKKLAASLETEMAGVKAEDTIPQLSPDLDKQIATLSVAVSSVASSKQTPAPLLTEIAQARAVSAAGSAFGRLKAIIEARQYLEAKDVLDGVSVQTSKIGPETTRVIVALNRTTAASISEFSRLREEGQVQASANKPAEALAAYEKAYAVIPDPAVGEQIAQLKEKLPKKK